MGGKNLLLVTSLLAQLTTFCSSLRFSPNPSQNSPLYAFRTYFFLLPSYLSLATLKSALSLLPSYLTSTISLFHCHRLLLILLTSLSLTAFTRSLTPHLPPPYHLLTFILTLTSSGFHLVSPSFLPSSLALTLTMLSASYHLQTSNKKAIAVGMAATTCLAWPFVSVLYIPLGLSTVIKSYASGGALSALKSVAFAVCAFTVMTCATAIVDRYYYGLWTVPNLNIFVYNALGGPGALEEGKTGDELYGVEPASYYVKNLVLNFGTTAIFVLLLPVVATVKR